MIVVPLSVKSAPPLTFLPPMCVSSEFSIVIFEPFKLLIQTPFEFCHASIFLSLHVWRFKFHLLIIELALASVSVFQTFRGT